jgi:hypothetical protein
MSTHAEDMQAIAEVNRINARIERDAANLEQEAYARRPDVRAAKTLELIFAELEHHTIVLTRIASSLATALAAGRDATPR